MTIIQISMFSTPQSPFPTHFPNPPSMDSVSYHKNAIFFLFNLIFFIVYLRQRKDFAEGRGIDWIPPQGLLPIL